MQMISYLIDSGEPFTLIDFEFLDINMIDDQLVENIGDFCFPDKSKFPVSKLSNRNKKFTLVFTRSDGSKLFGYCNREMIEKSFIQRDKKLAICYCILTSYPCHSIFNGLLDSIKGLSNEQIRNILTQLRSQSLPNYGEGIKITYPVSSDSTSFLSLSRPIKSNSLSEYACFDILLKNLDNFSLLSILLGILLERKFIFISDSLSVLSNCIQGFVALLYPLVWQHVFIPILPVNLFPILSAPVPFILGILGIYKNKIDEHLDEKEDVTIVYLDKSTIETSNKDYTLLPDTALLPLLHGVQYARMVFEDKTKLTDDETNQKDQFENETYLKILENAFIKFLIEVIGHFNLFINVDGFDFDRFINYKPELSDFLKILSNTQLFHQFLLDNVSQEIVNTHLTTDFTRLYTFSSDIERNKALKGDILIKEGWLDIYMKGGGKTFLLSLGKNQNVSGMFQKCYFRLYLNTLTFHRLQNSETQNVIDLHKVEGIIFTEFEGIPNCVEIECEGKTFHIYSQDLKNLRLWVQLILWRMREIAQKKGICKRALLIDKPLETTTVDVIQPIYEKREGLPPLKFVSMCDRFLND